MATLSDTEYLDFLITMKRKCRRVGGKVKRERCTQAEREKAIHILGVVLDKGGSVQDAAEMMGLDYNTLMNWYDSATAPDSSWRLDKKLAGRHLDMPRLAKHMLAAVRA